MTMYIIQNINKSQGKNRNVKKENKKEDRKKEMKEAKARNRMVEIA